MRLAGPFPSCSLSDLGASGVRSRAKRAHDGTGDASGARSAVLAIIYCTPCLCEPQRQPRLTLHVTLLRSLLVGDHRQGKGLRWDGCRAQATLTPLRALVARCTLQGCHLPDRRPATLPRRNAGRVAAARWARGRQQRGNAGHGRGCGLHLLQTPGHLPEGAAGGRAGGLAGAAAFRRSCQGAPLYW